MSGNYMTNLGWLKFLQGCKGSEKVKCEPRVLPSLEFTSDLMLNKGYASKAAIYFGFDLRRCKRKKRKCKVNE